jgi:glutamate racemase
MNLIPTFSRDFFCFFLKNNTIHTTEAPIGIFDSGLGGLSICKEIVKLMPNESIIYLADSRNAPYGEKSKEEIRRLSIKNVELLIALGCKVIVVACNTATTNAISLLRATYSIPFIGIEPATKAAALLTKTGKIGVLATKGTLQSELFITTSNQFRGHLDIIEVQGAELVRLIETGDLAATIPLLKKYLRPMVNDGVDNVVLGCTHYPFLIPIIKEILPNNITIVDSGEAVARQTLTVLKEKQVFNTTPSLAKKMVYTNKQVAILKTFLTQIQLDADVVSFKEF